MENLEEILASLKIIINRVVSNLRLLMCGRILWATLAGTFSRTLTAGWEFAVSPKPTCPIPNSCCLCHPSPAEINQKPVEELFEQPINRSIFLPFGCCCWRRMWKTETFYFFSLVEEKPTIFLSLFFNTMSCFSFFIYSFFLFVLSSLHQRRFPLSSSQWRLMRESHTRRTDCSLAYTYIVFCYIWENAQSTNIWKFWLLYLGK